MRLAIGGFSHETNTFADSSTGLTQLSDFRVLTGAEIVDEFAGSATYVGGFLRAAAEIAADVVPTFWAQAMPSGTIMAGAYSHLTDALLLSLRAAAPFDALALELHGAAVAEGARDADGELLARLRAEFPTVPIVVAADLHGNVTQRMVDSCDLLLPVRHYPHTDMGDRGEQVVRAVPALLGGAMTPVMRFVRLPMLLVPTSTVAGQPGELFLELMSRAEAHARVVDCSVWHGFTRADVPTLGVHVVVTTDDDPELATHIAQEIADAIWEARDSFRPLAFSPEEGLARALDQEQFPALLHETSDNPGGGAPGDGTHLLGAMLCAGLTSACFGFVCDPDVVAAALTAGVGSSIEVLLGGKTDDLHGAPLRVLAYVKSVSDGRWTARIGAPGMRFDHGRMVRLVIQGIDVLVSEQRSQTFEPGVFQINGIDVRDRDIIGIKGAHHFRAGFADVARSVFTVDAPGLTSLNGSLPLLTEVPRPCWPLDP